MALVRVTETDDCNDSLPGLIFGVPTTAGGGGVGLRVKMALATVLSIIPVSTAMALTVTVGVAVLDLKVNGALYIAELLVGVVPSRV